MIQEILWWLHSSKKEGLIPRVHYFDETSVANSAIIDFAAYTHDDEEFDFLLTQCVAQGYDPTFTVTHVKRLTIHLDIRGAVVTLAASGVQLLSASSINTVETKSPFLVRNGDGIHVAGYFNVADPNNTVKLAGYGFLIPKLEI